MTSDGAEGYPVATNVLQTERGPIPSYRSIRTELNTITRLEHLQIRLQRLQEQQAIQDEEEIYLSSNEGIQDYEDMYLSSNEDNLENEVMYPSSSEDYSIGMRAQQVSNVEDQLGPQIRTVPQAEAGAAEDMAGDEKEKKNRKKSKVEQPKAGAVMPDTAYDYDIPYMTYVREFIQDAKTVKVTCINSRWCKWSRWCLAYWSMIIWTSITGTMVYMATDYAAQHLNDSVFKDTWLQASTFCPKKTRRDLNMEQEQEHDMGHNTPFPILFLLMHLAFQGCIIIGMFVYNTHSTNARNRMITEISRLLSSEGPIMTGLSVEYSTGTSNLHTCKVTGAVHKDTANRQE